MTATIAAVVAGTAPFTAQASTAHTSSTVAQAKQEIRRLWGRQAPRAFCIVRRESGWNPRAVSRTGDYGLTQLNARTWAPLFGARWVLVLDPVENVRMAYVIYKRAGFSPWRGGRYPC